MDGLLLIDKPVGPTSHDIVARVRRLLGERAIGHTGTLDPLASGLLPLVLGRATRLARFLSASDKSYLAEIRIGVATDTYDAQGAPSGAVHAGAMPTHDEIDRALDGFRGTFLQRPPVYSAKKIDGERSYTLARRARRAAHSAGPALAAAPAPAVPPALPAPASVTARAIGVMACDGDRVTLRVDCSAGFYVRSLAHDLGQRLGVGAHLTALRRTRSGGLTVDSAATMEALEHAVAAGRPPIVPLSGMLTDFASVVLTSDGVLRATHGRDLGPADFASAHDESQFPNPESRLLVRLLSPTGELVGLGEPIAGAALLHPSIVLR